MDDGPVAVAQATELMAGPGSDEREVHQIHQYQSIVKFRDAVFSGKHPSVKLPSGVVPVHSDTRQKSAETLPNGESSTARNAQAVSANALVPMPPPPPPSAPSHEPILDRPRGSAPAEFNPILLEKSDELIQAEIKLQRQRLERSLKEDVEQRRGAKSERAELLTDIDLSDVLVKALALVQATSAPVPIDSNLTAANEASSDSFDDNTFYSSRHDTPESRLAALVQSESDDGGEYEPAESQPVLESNPIMQNALPSGSLVNEVNATQNTPLAQPQGVHTDPREAASYSSVPVQVPGLNNYPSLNGTSASVIQNNSVGSRDRPNERRKTDVDRPAPQKDAREHIDDFYVDTHPPSPLVRSRPEPPQAVAPQSPASPFIVREAPAQNAVLRAGVAPAQVAALRNEPTTATSPESSPHAGKGSNKKKGKKKRKVDRQAPEDVMPYIKPEPRSPSPSVNAPAYIRPNKRQKHAQKQPQDVEMTEARPPRDPQQPPLSYEPSPYRGGQLPVEYGAASNYPQRSVTAGFAQPAYSAGYLDDRRPAESYAIPQASSPQFYPPRPPSVVYSARPLVVNDGYPDQQRVYREHPEAARVSTRPESDAYGQPRPPSRLLVDSFGREYIEPPRPVVRQSVGPPVHRGEPEIVYERAVPRPAPRHVAPPPAFDDGHMVYTRASSAYPMPRRVVTQPEYIQPDFTETRYREYSTRPLGPPTEYIPMAPPARPPVQGDAQPREYTGRAVSVRPAEPARYEMPYEYTRTQSVRPEGYVREYIEPMPAERHRPAAEPYAIDYGTRPVEAPTPQRSFSARPVERYYDQSQPPPQSQPPRADNITYIERPQPPAHEFAYTENARRDVYR